MIRFLLVLGSILLGNGLIGQVSGTISDAEGNTLPFVNVFVENTTIGTASNTEGDYHLVSPIGSTLIFRYIGFEDYKLPVTDEVQIANIVMITQAVKVDEVVISANAEDPAYGIIRKAIAKRDFYKNQVDKYTANAYTKGSFKMLKSPKKILGREIGDMEGVLDTAGQGIIYLSESQSMVYHMSPNKTKEVMYSSKVSGSDGSYDFNRLSNMQFDIYSEYYKFNRTVVNPLADNSFTYYKFRLEGEVYGQDGQVVNKIAVLPKSENRPVGFGHIYIVEDTWNVIQLDLSLTGKALKEPLFDTINIKQQFLPVGTNGVWRMFSQEMSFTLGALGFKVGGTFSNIFSDYDIDPDFDESLFSSEEFKMNADASKSDSSFWSEVRPIPLTIEEREDYIKKDSLSELWETKTWKDSIDSQNNKFSIGDFLFGYDWSNSYKKRYLDIDSPLSAYRFNIVEGHSLQLGIKYRSYDSTEVKKITIGTKLRYGFSDKKVKASVDLAYRSDLTHLEFFSVGAGDTYKQFYNDDPVSPFYNTVNSLFYKNNEISLYRSKYLRGGYQRELTNGLYFWATAQYENRTSLKSNTDYSFFHRDEAYFSNSPITRSPGDDYRFDENNSLSVEVKFRWRPGQTYASLPKWRERKLGYLPEFRLSYKKGFVDTDYDRLTLEIKDTRMSLREYGHSKFRFSAGTFMSSKKTTFVDRHHFFTNTYTFTNLDRYLMLYKLLPHYTYSSTKDYFTFHYEHHFDGYIMDVIPLLKNLGAKFVIGANTLQMIGKDSYYEASIGIDQLKLGVFSVFRMDYSWSFSDDGLLDHGFFIGVSTDIGG